MKPELLELVPLNYTGAPPKGDAQQITDIWNAACGANLQISARTAAYNLQPAGGADMGICLARQDGQAVGFVAASAVIDPTTGLEPTYGWIDALAVIPAARNQGAGGQLLGWGEAWLKARGCRLARLAGALRPFAAGLPVETDSAAFFEKRGYAGYPAAREVWDVGHSLAKDTGAPRRPGRPAEVRPLQDGEQPALAEFFQREFPGRWQYEFAEHLRQGGRLSDYLALWIDGQAHGFCQVTFEDSQRPIERFFPHGLPRPWGQLGPIGVGAACRGLGMGGFLLDAGLRYLKARGVDGCIIDWTDLPEFYLKFGFHLHRQYLVLHKELA